MPADIIQPVTRTEALRQVDYSIRVAVVHERFFQRINKALKLVELVGGSTAIGGLLGQSTTLMAWSTAAVAVAAYVNLVYDFGDGARRHGVAHTRFAALKAKAIRENWNADQIEAGMKEIPVDDGGFVIDALRFPCFNEVQAQAGLYSNMQPLTRWQRFFRALA